MKILIVAAWIVAGLALAAGVALALGARAWSRTTADVDARVRRGAQPPSASFTAILPDPARRYLQRAAPPDARPIAVARLTQEGEFQMGEGPGGWCPFTATEVFRAVPPAFYWDARIRMAPLVTVRVRDAYLDGEGSMLGRVLGLIPVVDESGGRALAEGALYRYLAEAVWLPTRLLPGDGLSWAPLDDSSAKATLTDGDVSVAVRFTFDEAGDVVGVYALRPMQRGDEYVDTPWVGSFADHRDVDGYRIPTRGEVRWVVGGVDTPYWRGRVTEARFESEDEGTRSDGMRAGPIKS